MNDSGDTITAVASGAGRAGIGIIRISGPLAPQIAQAICQQALPVREACYLPFIADDSSVLDRGIALLFEAPHSFTGEHVLELQGHGGPVVLDMVMQRVLQLGARIARPGEFSERAFLNDKLDLAQAEAISDLIDSSSVAAAKAAVRSMSGEFSAHVGAIQEELIAVRVWLEAALDFSEEDIDFLAEPALQQRAVNLVSEFDNLLARAEQGQRLRDGLTIVIAGVTNAGKSSLLNALAGADTAIVTDIEGTTRDVLREEINIDGVPLHVVDTAGLRATDDQVELEGIRRARAQMDNADHVLVIIDATRPALPDIELPESVRRTVIINKSDQVDETTLASLTQQFDASFCISAKVGDGLDALKAYLLSLAGHDSAVEGVYSARRRHLDALYHAREATDAALYRLRESSMPELAAEELRLAQRSLDQISGVFDSEDLLGRIFSDFCIGK
ncbi:tRNA uridine-5-carboxymethylaminomethyl(34) synthesis GTPase MnmE [Granulosicoccus antarcticus]|uniref:tRNA modification GTPase MnmE n=1 Tax=Granulosicoccus antarcticus IMCC3135 TaxID=1192854 RepID=A0A2Z2P5U3_9GAMM|nr:tRNA uridine-5-carboxymethylaminomethyl(34) synthesis GTPase MnmE [Granulosicoccus antarcticus]ASJ76890.1 tRNA modification GTPase MnmE [Granulosicoccus antarcticus IMCC3135]